MDSAEAGDGAIAVDDLFFHAEIMGAVATSLSISSKLPSSRSKPTRSRAVSFPSLLLAFGPLRPAPGFGSGVAAADFLHSIFRHPC